MLRRQLPAYSPVTVPLLRAAVAGLGHEPEGLREDAARALAVSYRAHDALLAASGTAALQLALAGARAAISPGHVALPAYGCYDLASAAVGAQAPVILYDLEPATLAPETTSLRQALETEPVALVAAHLYGHPADMESLANAARGSGAILIEDAAQGSGGSFGRAPLGSFGSVSVLSFGRGKGATTGAGGALLAHDDAGQRIVDWARAHVDSAARGTREAMLLFAQWLLGRPRMFGIPARVPGLRLGETHYRPPRRPQAMSMASLRALAAHASVQDGVMPRRKNAERLRAHALRSTRVEAIEVVEGAEPGFIRLPLRAVDRSVDDIVRSLAHLGVAAAYPAPLTELAELRAIARNANRDFSGARVLSASLFTFPTHMRLEETDIVRLEAWLR